MTGYAEVMAAAEAMTGAPISQSDPRPPLPHAPAKPARMPQEIRITNLADGARWLFDDDAVETPIWGTSDDAIWMPGESLMIVGPIGVGKTTLAGLLVAGRMGLRPDVLGYPIERDDRPVLYLAMDRPRQTRRALLRQFSRSRRGEIEGRLVVQRGPVMASIIDNPGILLEIAMEVGAGTVVIDSIKDIVPKLSDDAMGNAYNTARQLVVAAGVEVLELHHQRKTGASGGEPRTITDVYGSTWIAAGAGSIGLLWGETGDVVIEWRHLKSPAGEVGPLRIINDIAAGEMSVVDKVTALDALAAAPQLMARDLAAQMYDDSPTPSQVENARRQLDRLVKSDDAETFTAALTGRGGKAPTLYRITDQGRSRAITSNHAGVSP